METVKDKSPKRTYQTLTAYRLLHVTSVSPFYEEYGATGSDQAYDLTVPEDWSTSEDATWKYYFPPVHEIPMQGWKIHVSACPDNDCKILDCVSRLLFQKAVPFKHRVTKGAFMQANMKYSDRGSSGKFITIYPRDDDQFCALLGLLDDHTNMFEGPYILSDTKYKEGPIYFRYGGFYYRNRINEDGSTELAIQDSNGQLVKDERAPIFILPEFASVPDPISSQVNSRLNPDSEDLDNTFFPYVVQESLHFSNGGGVYLAINGEDKTKAVLKEARPFTGYTTEDENAISRLRQERDVLIALQDMHRVPRYFGYIALDGHEFLIESYLEGTSLQSWLASHFPFSFDSKKLVEYSKNALEIAKKITSLVDTVHDHGYALMDINSKNFVVDDKLNVSLLDFEACRKINESNDNVLGTPGFVPFSKCSNNERDLYGMTNLLFYMFWPSWTSAFSPKTLRTGLRNIHKHFPSEVSDFLSDYLNRIPNRVLQPRFSFEPIMNSKENNATIIQGLVDGIQATRLKAKSKNRLYPGDATQFLHGRLGSLDIETGAAGVMLMLSRVGCNINSDAEWILEELSKPDPLSFHGLLRGTVGIASALSQSGFIDESLCQLPKKLPDCSLSDISIRTGISGTILALSEIAGSSQDLGSYGLLKAASHILETSILENRELVSPGAETGNAVGLFDGWSGAAVACNQISCQFEEKAKWKELMHICLQREINNLTESDDGTLYVDYSGVNFGYLSEGTAGVASALAICAPDEYSEVLNKLHPGLVEFIALNGGLFRGLGGKIAALSAINHDDDAANISLMLRNVLESFLFSSTESSKGVFTLGDGGACLSSDYSSGAAGLIGLLLSLEKKSIQWFPVPLH